MWRLFKWVGNAVTNIGQYFYPNKRRDDSILTKSHHFIDLEDGEADEVINENPQVAAPIEAQVNQSYVSARKVISDLSKLVLASENRPHIAGAALLTGMSTMMNFLSPYLLGETYTLLNSEDENANLAGVELSRAALITMTVTSYMLTHVLPNLRDQMMVPVTANNTKKMLRTSTAHILKKSLNTNTNTDFPEQLYVVQKAWSASIIGTPILTQIAPMVVEIAIACTVLGRQYGALEGVGVLGLLAAYTGYSAITAKPIINAQEARLKANNEAFINFTSSIKKYKIMHDFCKFDETMQEVDDALNALTKTSIVGDIRPLQIAIGHQVLSRLSLLIASLYVGLGVQTKKFTAKEFLVLFGYLNQLSTLLPVFGQAVNQVFAAYPDARFVLSKLAQPDEVVDLHPGVSLPIVKGEPPTIEFEHVAFSYPPKPGERHETLVFRDLSFKIQAGEKVAFVSESGAGKSTILNLLFQHYKPTSGTIKINGKDISTVSLNDLQKNITLFGQEANLFKGTIRQNIIYGAANSAAVTDEMIYDLARSVNLYEFLQSFNDKLKTDVGDDGKALSGGQQQKVAILRGLMKKSPIHLLDEVTASIDSQSAHEVMESLNASSANQTSLMVTHKLTEVQEADRIIVLKDGKVSAEGTHDQLLGYCELYQRLWRAYKHESDVEKVLDDSREERITISPRR